VTIEGEVAKPQVLDIDQLLNRDIHYGSLTSVHCIARAATLLQESRLVLVHHLSSGREGWWMPLMAARRPDLPFFPSIRPTLLPTPGTLVTEIGSAPR